MEGAFCLLAANGFANGILVSGLAGIHVGLAVRAGMHDSRPATDLRHYSADRGCECNYSPAGALRQTVRVTEIRPAADADAAQWLLRSDVGWQDLVRYGPPGFDVYVRIAFRQDAGSPPGEAPVDAVRAALATLGSYTTTPSRGYAAIWEGWTTDIAAPQAPRVEIPHRVMLLFTGPVEALRDAPALAWYGSAVGIAQEPHLVWPEDHAWCLACEVDEEIEFTVGCSGVASQALAGALPGPVRRVGYGEPGPMYRDPA